MNIVDTTFGLNNQALAVLYFLNGRKLNLEKGDRPHLKTAPWYNGRERGFVLSVHPIMAHSKPLLHIAVFEHRNGDGMCALRWENPQWNINPPTIESDGKLAYPTDNKYDDIAFQVEHGEVGKMAEWVFDQVQDCIDAAKEAPVLQ